MGFKIYNQELLAAKLGSEQILAICIGNQKVWPSIILACQSNGYWIDEYPWDDEQPWNDNSPF